MKGKAKEASISKKIWRNKKYQRELIYINKLSRDMKMLNENKSITGYFMFKNCKDLISRK